MRIPGRRWTHYPKMASAIKLHQFSKRKSCYYCGAPPPCTREHAPPEMMFTGFQCDSITVPACDKHNTQKSIGDRAIVTAMIMGAYQVWKHQPKSTKLTPNVVKAIKILEPQFEQAKNEVALRDFLINPPPELNVPLPYIRPSISIPGWVRQLTAALVWSVTGRNDPYINWDKTWAWSPGLISKSQPIQAKEAAMLFLENRRVEEQLNSFVWRHGWSAKPRGYPSDIYSFEVAFIPSSADLDGMEVVVRHRFHNGSSIWYALFPASLETKAYLLRSTSIGNRRRKRRGVD